MDCEKRYDLTFRKLDFRLASHPSFRNCNIPIFLKLYRNPTHQIEGSAG